jgi:hypothetical protein
MTALEIDPAIVPAGETEHSVAGNADQTYRTRPSEHDTRGHQMPSKSAEEHEIAPLPARRRLICSFAGLFYFPTVVIAASPRSHTNGKAPPKSASYSPSQFQRVMSEWQLHQSSAGIRFAAIV